MNQRTAAVLLGGFVAGVLLRSFVDFGWQFAGFFVLIGIVLIILSFITESRKLFLLTGVFFFALAVGVLRYEFKDYKNKNLLEQKVEQRIAIEGIIVDEPDSRENYTKYVIESDSPVGGEKILVYSYHYPEFHYGDKIRAAGLLKKPQNINDSFNWISYLAKDDIYYGMIYPKIEFLSSRNASLIKEKLFTLKEKFIGNINKVIPEPHSSFMGGITVGARQSIPKDLVEDFRKTGIVHVIVLSGYNITLVADTTMKIFSFLPRVVGTSFGVLGIVLFTIMTGAGAATVRASIMALLIVLAKTTGRIYSIIWALIVTGFLMILHNPKILVFDTGFQLSFLATLSLIYLAPHFEQKLKFITKKWKLREIASATLATQVFVLPLLLYKTGLLSLVSLPVNLLILIFVPVTMFFGFITGGLGMISHLLSIPFGWISYVFLQYELWIVEWFAKLSFSSFTISNFPLGLTLGVYTIYGWWIYKIKKENQKNKK
ncbi:MAG: ComEC/Rec2 family competence protein [Patescibacteria group bacterium]